MRQFGEFGAFLLVAVVSHLAFFQGEQTGSAEAMGSAGSEMLTLSASSESLAAMVAQWERPVEIIQNVALPEMSTPQHPAVPSLSVGVSTPSSPRAAAPELADLRSEAADLPIIDTAYPLPPRFAAQQSARPVLRPARPARAQSKTAAQAGKKNAKRQVAAGAGQGKAAGNKREVKAPAKRQASSPAAMARWGGSIRSAVERRKKYPANTRAGGRVVLSVAVSSSGSLSSVRVKRSSGVAALDRAALTAVKGARFSAAPKGINTGVHHFSLPISFSR